MKSSDFLIKLQATITHYQLVDIGYISSDGEKSQRVIEPFALFCTHNNWILVAYCRLKDDFRAFRLDCISEMKIEGSVFEPHIITLSEYFEKCRKKWTTPDIPMA